MFQHGRFEDSIQPTLNVSDDRHIGFVDEVDNVGSIGLRQCREISISFEVVK